MYSSDGSLPSITLDAPAGRFFRDVVGHARAQSGVVASEASELYLTDLLVEHTTRSRLSGTAEQPFSVRLAHAMNTSGGERFERLRALGDDVLFLSGFFSEHLEHRGVAPKYAAGLGQIAYGGAASVLRKYSRDEPPVFAELSEKFCEFAALLRYVAESLFANAPRSETAILELYERWSRTGSNVLSEALLRLGVSPSRKRTGDN
jgi:hypothetical protein